MYEREFPSVYGTVHLLCRDPSVAEDATQEAFARALARWHRLKDRPWVAGWVMTTALNVARRSMRRRALPTASEAAESDRETRLDLEDAIRRLPPRQQEATLLHYVLDLPVIEVALAMKVDPGTVKTHLSRARAALARSLDVNDRPGDPMERDGG
jgi:RNA polymerase sigma-70 factor (ECF subfamily)